jgi:hypothetical protein
MLNIRIETLEGKPYISTLDQTSTEWICIGYGQDPKSGVNYVVGTQWDQVNNRSHIATHLLKDVTFKCATPPAKA